MIKFVVLFACAVLVVDCKYARTTVQFGQDLAAKIYGAAPVCGANSDKIPEMLHIIREGEYDDDPKFQAFVYCMCQETGFADENGKLYADRISVLFPDEEKVTKLVADCNNESGRTPLETNYKTYKCFQKNSPYKFAF